VVIGNDETESVFGFEPRKYRTIQEPCQHASMFRNDRQALSPTMSGDAERGNACDRRLLQFGDEIHTSLACRCESTQVAFDACVGALWTLMESIGDILERPEMSPQSSASQPRRDGF
jgi:hypothetical protein